MNKGVRVRRFNEGEEMQYTYHLKMYALLDEI